MTANDTTGYAGKDVTDNTRVTARGELDEDGSFSVEYEYWGRTFRSVDELEAALRGEGRW